MTKIPDTLETYKCMAISTAHLTYGMTERLDFLESHVLETNLLSRPYGYFVKLYSHDGEKNIKDYEYFSHVKSHILIWKRIIDFAVANDFQLIEFDCDAETLDIFPTFEW